MNNIINENLIARCRWQTSIDSEEHSYPLQQFISRWTQPDLQKLFERCIDEICPADQHWRIDTLQLDLGDINFQDLNSSVPEKVEQELRRALKEYALQRRSEMAHANQSFYSVEDALAKTLVNDDKNASDWFLEHGTAPWWYRSSDSISDALDRQFSSSASFIVQLIDKIHGRQVLRQRVLWQWGEVGCRHIVHQLEPHHSHSVEQLINSLCTINKQLKIVSLSGVSFSEKLWQKATEYLLRHSAASFNLHWLTQYLLFSLSQEFGLSHDQMISEILTASDDDQQSDILLSAYQQNMALTPWLEVISTDADDSDKAVSAWAVMAELLLARKHSVVVRYAKNINEQTLSLQDIFIRLADNNANQLVRLLKKLAKEKNVRRHLVTQLDQTHRIKAIHLLAPEQGVFICAHTQRSQLVLNQQKKDSEIVWDIVFAYLLQDSGSHFNRLQFVKQTLQQTCREQGLSYQKLLTLLLHSIVTNSGFDQRIELIEILQQLNKEQQARAVSQGNPLSYTQIIKNYLLHGKLDKAQSLPMINQDEHQLFLAYMQDKPKELWAIIYQCMQNNGALHKNKIFKNLIDLAGVNQFCCWLDQQINHYCENLQPLISQLQHWQQHACLPCLQTNDLTVLIYRSSLFAIGQKKIPNKQEIISLWLEQLALQLGCEHDELTRQINFCLQQQVHILASTSVEHLKVIDQQLSNTESSDISQQDLLAQLLAESDQCEYWSYSRKVTAIHCAIKLTSKINSYDFVVKQLLNEITDYLSMREWHDIINGLFQSCYSQDILAALINLKSIEPINHWFNLIERDIDQEKVLLYVADSLSENGIHISNDQQSLIGSLFWQVLVNNKLIEKFNVSQDQLQKKLLQLCYRYFKQSPLVTKSNKELDRNLAEGLINSQDNTSYQGNSVQEKTAQTAKLQQDRIQQYEVQQYEVQKNEIHQWLTTGRSPLWLQTFNSLHDSLHQQLTDQPLFIINSLAKMKGKNSHSEALLRLSSQLNLTEFIAIISKHNQNWQTKLNELSSLLSEFKQLNLSSSLIKKIEQQLTLQLLQAWLMKVTPLLDEKEPCSSDSTVHSSVSEQELITILQPALSLIPENILQASSFNQALADNANNINDKKIIRIDQLLMEEKSNLPYTAEKNIQIPENQIIEINNAGMVLLQGYLGMYLERLGLLKTPQDAEQGSGQKEFKDLDSQFKAIHCLQYLITGLTDTEEQHLLLNKLLCNVPFHQAVPRSITLSEADKEIAHGLLEAMINYWPDSGCNSIDGFRGNWLVREGILKETEEQWELTIDKRSYDLLLNRSPFSYSMIRLPWMTKPIYVNWHV